MADTREEVLDIECHDTGLPQMLRGIRSGAPSTNRAVYDFADLEFIQHETLDPALNLHELGVRDPEVPHLASLPVLERHMHIVRFDVIADRLEARERHPDPPGEGVRGEDATHLGPSSKFKDRWGSALAPMRSRSSARARSEISLSGLDSTSSLAEARSETSTAGTPTARASLSTTPTLGCRLPASISESWLPEISIRLASSVCCSPK